MSSNAFPVVFDGHNDVLLRLGASERGGPAAFFERNDGGHLDLPRAREGGFGGGFFAVWVPSPRGQPGERAPNGLPPALDAAYAMRRSIAAVATLFEIEDRSDRKFKIVRSVTELQRCLDEEVMPAVLPPGRADGIHTELG